MLLFALVMLAFSGFNSDFNLDNINILKYVLTVFLFISIAKFTLYYLLQKYRSSFGGNYRKTVIIGKNKQTLALEKFFNKLEENKNAQNIASFRDYKISQEHLDQLSKTIIDLRTSIVNG